MSEKKEKEKWETKKWYLFPSNFKPGFTSKSTMKSRALGYGKIIVEDDKISVGDFSLNYINIIRLEKNKHIYLIIYCIDERNYRLLLDSATGRTQLKSRDKLFSILSEKLKQFENVKLSQAKTYLKNLPNLYREISLNDLASKTALSRTDLMNIIESLILNGELNVEIRGDMIKLKKEQNLLIHLKDIPLKPPQFKK